MNTLELKFDYENTGFSRTHYKGTYKNKEYNIVIIHNKNIDEILTASKDGEPDTPLKEGLKVLLNNKNYIVKKQNGYSVLEEVKSYERKASKI